MGTLVDRTSAVDFRVCREKSCERHLGSKSPGLGFRPIPTIRPSYRLTRRRIFGQIGITGPLSIFGTHMPTQRSRFHASCVSVLVWFAGFGLPGGAFMDQTSPKVFAASPTSAERPSTSPSPPPHASAEFERHSAPRPDAAEMAVQTTMLRLAHGPSFDAKLRQTVWSEDRQILGVGTCTHAGRGTGRYRIQVTMHDGRDKHSMMQISDGRLAWTSLTVGGNQRIGRVDLGRVDHGDPSLVAMMNLRGGTYRTDTAGPGMGGDRRLSRAMRVGGLIEMLDQIGENYRLHLRKARLHDVPVWVISGQMDVERRSELAASMGVGQLSRHHPGHVRVVIADQDDPQTGFGRGLPVRFEYWNQAQPVLSGEPAEVGGQARENRDAESVRRQMVSVIELHAVRPIETPDAVDFRYEWTENDVDFVNETSRYQRGEARDASMRAAATDSDPRTNTR